MVWQVKASGLTCVRVSFRRGSVWPLLKVVKSFIFSFRGLATDPSAICRWYSESHRAISDGADLLVEWLFIPYMDLENRFSCRCTRPRFLNC